MSTDKCQATTWYKTHISSRDEQWVGYIICEYNQNLARKQFLAGIPFESQRCFEIERTSRQCFHGYRAAQCVKGKSPLHTGSINISLLSPNSEDIA